MRLRLNRRSPSADFIAQDGWMIPRRRIDIEWSDALDLLGGLVDREDVSASRVRDFQTLASTVLGGRSVLATASGRDALDLALDGLGITSGDEVIVPAYTLGELIPRLQARGLRLVAADVSTESYCVTRESMAAAMSKRTRAAIVLHTFGAPCDLLGIADLLAQHRIPLIEDCAHAFGAESGGRPVGTVGVAAIFSLEVAKPISTFGGGLLATDDPALLRSATNVLSRRRKTQWPITRKFVLKCIEEFAVRSPAYAMAARAMFRERSGGRFESAYRAMHDIVRREDAGFSNFQARRGTRRIDGRIVRNERLGLLWRQLADAVPDSFTPQRTDRYGAPTPYNFVARYAGDVERLRYRAQRMGLDLAIGSEVLDDVASLLGQRNCPNSAKVFRESVAIPLHLGVGPATILEMSKILSLAAKP